MSEPERREPLDAGTFSAWLDTTRKVLREGVDAVVPCGGCTACCTASQFVHIGPEESATIEAIPRELLFPAPRLAGHFVLGYDERGHCPMLVEGECSIYEHRPKTCRTYDCRVFAATGVELDDEEKCEIAARVERWRFTYPQARDRVDADSVRHAARYLAYHRVLADEDCSTATAVATTAVEIGSLFAEGEPAHERVRVAVRAARAPKSR